MPDSQTNRKYTPPKLQVFGDIRAITQAVSQTGDTDGATVGPRRTTS